MPSYDEVTQRSGSVRAMTGFTEPECTALLPHGERALAADLQHRPIDGHPRSRRRDRAYAKCPWPTRAGKRLFLLTSLTQHPIQEVPGQLGGMSQSPATQGMHVLPPGWTQAVADPERLPARTAAECAARFETHAADGSSSTPLVGMRALHGRSTARPIPKRNTKMTAASRRVTRANTAW
jgi:hypothetical protein